MDDSDKTRNLEIGKVENQDKTDDNLDIKLKWRKPFEFSAYCLLITLGLGNAWRFPYEAFKHGGGTFLISYVLVACIFGQPFYYLEIILGQFLSKSNVGTFKALAPGFAGISGCQAIACAIISSYYSAITAFSLFYLFRSYLYVLPWSICQKEWANSCVTFEDIKNKSLGNYILSEELFLFKKVLNLKYPDDLNEGIGAPNIEMIMYSFSIWLVIFLLLSRGIKTIFTLLYCMLCIPFFIILALVVRVTHFDGADIGISYLFRIDWANILSPKVLHAAVMQCCFSLTQGVGVVTTYASLNEYNYPAKAISIVVVLTDMIVSITFGIMNFSVMGTVAWNLNVSMGEIPKFNAESMFIYYLEAFDSIKCGSRLYSVLLFFIIFVISLGSLQGLQMLVVTQLRCFFPKWKYWHLAMISTGISFGLSVLYFTPGGAYLIKLVNTFGCDMVLGTLVIIILVAICYNY
ncbi:hypothetical protein ILUMI_19040, partial [Ignelater luminosus]